MAKLKKHGVVLDVQKDGRMNVTAKDGRLGWREIGFFVKSAFGEGVLAGVSVSQTEDAIIIRGEYARQELAEEIRFELLNCKAAVVTRKVTRIGKGSTTILEVKAGKVEGRGAPVFSDNDTFRARFGHMDNVRTELYPWSRPEAPYIRGIPRTPTPFGNQENVPLPAILFTNDTYSETLVEGQLEQNISRIKWMLSSGPSAILEHYELLWDLYSGGVMLQTGESLQLEPVMYQIKEHSHPQDAFDQYIEEVVGRNRLRQKNNILHTNAMYCNYNYGVYMEFDEKTLLQRADVMAKHLPGITHYLLDCGWYENLPPGWPDTALFYDKRFVNKEKFPQGLKAFADRLKKRNFSPAIWWSPSVDMHSGLAKEHPEWLAKDPTGAPYRICHAGYLDYGHPDVQRYLHGCWKMIFKEWGYESMKMDFWCQSVESNVMRFSRGTGVQWRDWLLNAIRSYLPPDGFLMTCVAMSMGNPFLGKSAHTYRCGADVGSASWADHINASLWVQPMLSLEGRKTCLLNVDGIGVNPGLSNAENLHRLTYGFITMGSLEIDGKMEVFKPNQLDWLRRTTTNIDRGYKVHCPDDDCYTGKPLPKALYVDYPTSSRTGKRGVRKHIALFNWTDKPQYTGYTAEQLGLEGTTTVRDFWTDEVKTFPAGDICERMPGRSSRLYEVAD